MSTLRLRADTARLDLEFLIEIVIKSLVGEMRPAYLRKHSWEQSLSEDGCTLVFTLSTQPSAGLQLHAIVKGLGKNEAEALRLKVESANEPGGLSLKFLTHLRKEMDNLEYNLREMDSDMAIYR